MEFIMVRLIMPAFMDYKESIYYKAEMIIQFLKNRNLSLFFWLLW